MVEFERELRELDWYRKGHVGYVLAGEGELQLDEQTIRFKAGDGLFLPTGEEHQHRLRVVSAPFRCVLVEDL